MLVKQLKQLKSHLCADEFKSWLTNATIYGFYIDALKQREEYFANGYFVDPDPSYMVQTLPFEGPRILRVV